MNEKDFIIDKILGMEMQSIDGTPLMEKEKPPVRQKTLSLSDDVRDLLVESIIPLEWIHKEPFSSYGEDLSTSMCDRWVWDRQKISNETNEMLLWKMYGQISSYWLTNYEYWYHNSEYKFKKYRYEHGDNPYKFEMDWENK